jgi:hypothetical protein
VQGRPGIAAPGDGFFLEELGEQVDFLFKQFVIVSQVVPEQREGLGAGSSSEDDFGAAVGE